MTPTLSTATATATASSITRPRLAIVASLALALALALPSAAPAIDAGDMDPHLPGGTILEVLRFQAFTRKATNKLAWDRKHAAFLESLEAQLEEASLSDNRSATALRTLIKDVKDAKYVPRKAAPSKLPGEYAVLPNGYTVLVNEGFHIDTPESRVLTYPFEIASVPAMIKVAIGGGSDDSGDGGLHYLLIDPIGRVIKRGFANSDDFVWEEHQGTRTGTWKLIIEDLDTDLRDKKSPGNRGAVEVMAKAE